MSTTKKPNFPMLILAYKYLNLICTKVELTKTKQFDTKIVVTRPENRLQVVQPRRQSLYLSLICAS